VARATGVQVRVANGAVVYEDGRAYRAGQTLTVSAARAASLVERGLAETEKSAPWKRRSTRKD
jgi:hypothetical protein